MCVWYLSLQCMKWQFYWEVVPSIFEQQEHSLLAWIPSLAARINAFLIKIESYTASKNNYRKMLVHSPLFLRELAIYLSSKNPDKTEFLDCFPLFNIAITSTITFSISGFYSELTIIRLLPFERRTTP